MVQNVISVRIIGKTKKPFFSCAFVDWFEEINLDGISSLIKTIILPPNWLRSKQKDKAYPGTLNFPLGKGSSNFILECINISSFGH